jgi:protein-S-isoprenylcysteine O-methyltransferase Ste14
MARGLIRWAFRGLAYKVFVALVLMGSAGRWDWVAGWTYVAIFLLFDIATAAVVIPRSPDLLIERSVRPAEMQDWDRVIMPLAAGLLPMASWIVAGLDVRFGWEPLVATWLQIISLVITILGFGIVVWAMGANAYFSPVVRLQEERGQNVATGGPYGIVRHPGYLGAILFTAATPLLLGSWWALIPGMLASLLYVLRTALEDRFLQSRLEGYREYAREVPYRLIPGVW